MPKYLIIRLLILGSLAVFGIIFIQAYWVTRTWDIKDREFDERVHLALRETASSLAGFNKTALPKSNFIQRKASNYYAVNINSSINANILEDYLITSFEAFSLNTDFEFAVYDCSNEQLVYGNYCRLSDDERTFARSDSLAVIPDLTYYFVVKFPSRAGYVLSNMKTSVGFSMVALLAIAFFLYAIWVILRQKELNEMQKDFINNMTHEFKTPISSIKIASEVLMRNEEIRKDERLFKYSSIINEQNQRLNRQVERVLSTAKMDTDGLKFRKEYINVNELLMEIVEAERLRLAQMSNGEISLILPQQRIELNIDKMHFTNMIYSLLDNAIKYCAEIPNVNITLDGNSKDVFVHIKDNGLGIMKEDIPKLFQKFFRVSTGNVHDVKGFGLGLFYVKNVVEGHKGTIHVESEINKGSCFSIKLPTV